ncbi:hypothetical protein B0H17DRAFT_1149041 [Mycena rosella]|uniref:Uncharacterized protein n=1 Tax=Mycena rosella TaxID=1033263 RepID=A0AAD7C6D9_MYCRO|nr:hypothetical protein B0H17DRAFT_1149041 [Mycena rosella]
MARLLHPQSSNIHPIQGHWYLPSAALCAITVQFWSTNEVLAVGLDYRFRTASRMPLEPPLARNNARSLFARRSQRLHPQLVPRAPIYDYLSTAAIRYSPLCTITTDGHCLALDRPHSRSIAAQAGGGGDDVAEIGSGGEGGLSVPTPRVLRPAFRTPSSAPDAEIDERVEEWAAAAGACQSRQEEVEALLVAPAPSSSAMTGGICARTEDASQMFSLDPPRSSSRHAAPQCQYRTNGREVETGRKSQISFNHSTGRKSTAVAATATGGSPMQQLAHMVTSKK